MEDYIYIMWLETETAGGGRQEREGRASGTRP